MGVCGCPVSQGPWVQLQTLPMSLGRNRQSRLLDETAAGREEVDKQLDWRRRGQRASSEGVASRGQRSREGQVSGHSRAAVAGSPTHAFKSKVFLEPCTGLRDLR